MKAFRVLILWVIFLLLASTSFAADEEAIKQKIINHVMKFLAQAKIQDPTLETPTRSPAGPRLYRQVVNSVVFIATEEGLQGSGILLSSDGLIITNWHVVQDSPMVGVIFKPATSSGKNSLSEKDVLFARVLKTESLRDLALLKLVSPPANRTSAQFGSLASIEVGQDVFAVSHPEGLLWSYTEGVISAIRPKIEWTSDKGITHRATLIQTQTVISFGSSGGPLFDDNGRLIGILVITKGPGLNFAIAVDEVEQFSVAAMEKR
jgi:S1-C subfamily serine protease